MISDKTELKTAVNLIEGGDLSSAHQIVQTFEGIPVADTTHAVIHRREGDFANSLYWWRRVGGNVPHELISLYGDPATFTAALRDGCVTGDTGTILDSELSALVDAVESSVLVDSE